MSTRSYKNGHLYRDPGFLVFLYNLDNELTRRSVCVNFSETRKPYALISVKYFTESSPFEYGFRLNPFSCKALIRDCMKQLTL